MKGTFYRLGHYKILENIDGTLWWESYAGFARTKSGGCFINGEILFLEPAIEIGEPGFLIMEYNEALNKLPNWTKSRYYCTNYTLRSSRTDKIVSKVKIGLKSKEQVKRTAINLNGKDLGIDGYRTKSSGDKKAALYKLGRYKIVEYENGELWWNFCSHLNRLEGGRGFIEGEILFVGHKKIEESVFPKKEFIHRLNKLPKWEKTEYYCTYYSLKPCRPDKISPEKKIDNHLKEESFKRIHNKVRLKKKKTFPADSNKNSDAIVKFKAAKDWSLKLFVVMLSLLVLIIDLFFLFCRIAKKYIKKIQHHLFFGKDRRQE